MAKSRRVTSKKADDNAAAVREFWRPGEARPG
jgi:hypothetical protein